MYKVLSLWKLPGMPHSDGKVADKSRLFKFRYVKDLKDPQDGGNAPALDMQVSQQNTG